MLIPEVYDLSPISIWTLSHWPPLFRYDLKPVPCPLNGPPIKSVPFRLGEKDVVGDRVKGLSEVQIDDNSSSSLVHWHNSSQKATRLFRHDLPPWWSHADCLVIHSVLCWIRKNHGLIHGLMMEGDIREQKPAGEYELNREVLKQSIFKIYILCRTREEKLRT